jgi:hypothetical protein
MSFLKGTFEIPRVEFFTTVFKSSCGHQARKRATNIQGRKRQHKIHSNVFMWLRQGGRIGCERH